MTPTIWLGLIGLAVNVIVLLISLSWRGGSWSGIERRRINEIENELKTHRTDMDRRFNEAGKATSDAWTYVQGLESKFIREFAARDLTDERFKENRREHDRYDAALARSKRSPDSG